MVFAQRHRYRSHGRKLLAADADTESKYNMYNLNIIQVSQY